MKHSLAILLTIALLVPWPGVARARSLPDSGAWTLHGTGPVVFEVRLTSGGGDSEYGSAVPIGSLQGLSAPDLASNGASVRFDLIRDAGTLHCVGHVASGQGGGTFAYIPNADYARRLGALGIAPPSADEQRRMTFADVSLAFVQALRDGRVPVGTSAELVRLAEHGVTARFVSGLGELGYRVPSVTDLVRLVDHGVTLSKIRSFRDLGFHPTADELVRLVDHGVTTDFAREIASLGYRATMDQLVDMTDHGVTTTFVHKMASHQPKPSIDDLIRLRDAGI